MHLCKQQSRTYAKFQNVDGKWTDILKMKIEKQNKKPYCVV